MMVQKKSYLFMKINLMAKTRFIKTLFNSKALNQEI